MGRKRGLAQELRFAAGTTEHPRSSWYWNTQGSLRAGARAAACGRRGVASAWGRQELAGAGGGRARELAWERQPILHARRVCKL